jgi:hypothetical protein
MQYVKGKPPETLYATRPGARAKRREVALSRPGFEPGRIRAWLTSRPSRGQLNQGQECPRQAAPAALKPWRATAHKSGTHDPASALEPHSVPSGH